MFVKRIHCLRKKTCEFLFSATRGIHENVNDAVAASSNKFTPVSIDVPWGKIEGKLWGSTDKQPILTVHGYMDNAGSFDDIAPFLTKNSSILAIDMPGHGLSSWLPRGIPYNEDMNAMAMRMVVKNFGWKKVKLLGHSLGGIMSYNYARIFPDETEFVISLDSLAFVFDSVTQHSKRRARGIDRYIDFEKKIRDDPPSYPEDVVIDKWLKGTVFQSLDVPTVKTLMNRGVKKKKDGTYYFTRDSRLKLTGFNSCYTLEYLKEMTQLVTSPYLIIKASDTPHHSEFKYWGSIIEILKKSSKDCQVFSVKGSHHVHMMEPEMVARHIVPFLEKYDV